jgi:hypothetical protein
MGFQIREADVVSDLGLMRATLNANRTRETTPDRFEWLYLRNPDGLARAWFVVDDRSGDVAGFTAVFPRRVQVRGAAAATAWNCGDFSIHQKYRTGGAAVTLRRAARQAVDRGESPFLYAHPNDRMLPVHLRVGHLRLARMVRFAKPLRLPVNGVAGALSGTALRMAGIDWLPRPADDIETVDDRLGPEFDELFDAVERLGTALVRDSRYLDWRFRRSPSPDVLLTSRRNGRLTGFVAWTQHGDIAHIKDWLALDARAWRALFGALLRTARERRLHSISVIALETNPDLKWFRQFGFVPRPDSSTAVSYAPEGSPYRAGVTNADAWFMTVGDRDV